MTHDERTDLEARLAMAVERLREIQRLICATEITSSDYDDDDVDALNGAIGEIFTIAGSLLADNDATVATFLARIEAQAIAKHDRHVACVFAQVADDPSIVPLVGQPGSESADGFQRMIARIERQGAAKEFRAYADLVQGHILWDYILVDAIRQHAAELEAECSG